MALFGLTREARAFLERMEKKIDKLAEAILSLGHDTDTACKAVERHEQTMAALDSLAAKIAEARGAAQAEATEVKGKIDAMAALIVELQANATDPNEVVRLGGELDALITDTRAIFTGEAPPPVPEPGPGPNPPPEGRRR